MTKKCKKCQKMMKKWPEWPVSHFEFLKSGHFMIAKICQKWAKKGIFWAFLVYFIVFFTVFLLKWPEWPEWPPFSVAAVKIFF